MEVTGLWIYPVKAVRAVSLTDVVVERRGLAGDRRWLFVDADNRFLTQRDHPILATVSALPTARGLTLSAPGLHTVDVEPPFRGALRAVTIWRNEVDALDAGEDAAGWASELFGFPARLVFMGPDCHRPVDPVYGQPGDEVSFADGFPLLLANEASLKDLNARMETPLPMNRFRPNVVVAGAEAWEEDTWSRVRIGEVEFANVKPCGRCLVTTTDQTTGERMGDEPLRTLATFRQVDGKVMFGRNLIPLGLGTLHVGDEVCVID